MSWMASTSPRPRCWNIKTSLVKLVPAGQALVDRVKGMRCDVLDGTPSDEMAPIIVDIARTKAPGSVPYLELLIASSEFPVEGCLKDIPRSSGTSMPAARSAISPSRSDTTCSVWSRRSARPARS